MVENAPADCILVRQNKTALFGAMVPPSLKKRARIKERVAKARRARKGPTLDMFHAQTFDTLQALKKGGRTDVQLRPLLTGLKTQKLLPMTTHEVRSATQSS
jgi:hypothetical protein